MFNIPTSGISQDAFKESKDIFLAPRGLLVVLLILLSLETLPYNIQSLGWVDLPC